MTENEKGIASISSATDAYQHQRPLNNCVKDVTDIKNTLIEKYDFEMYSPKIG